MTPTTNHSAGPSRARLAAQPQHHCQPRRRRYAFTAATKSLGRGSHIAGVLIDVRPRVVPITHPPGVAPT
jgi:hypothetical protein